MQTQPWGRGVRDIADLIQTCSYLHTQGVVTYIRPVEAFATGIKMESSDQGLYWRRSSDQGLFLEAINDQDVLRATVHQRFSAQVNLVIP